MKIAAIMCKNKNACNQLNTNVLPPPFMGGIQIFRYYNKNASVHKRLQKYKKKT